MCVCVCVCVCVYVWDRIANGEKHRHIYIVSECGEQVKMVHEIAEL